MRPSEALDDETSTPISSSQARARIALPLFLDEALTIADEKRFAAVADSLESLARDEGRQVFYLSARRQELGLWERATGHRPHHIDLAAVRGRPAAAQDASYRLPPEQPVPRPEGKTPEAWAAALGVPPARPRQPASGVHVFHLLRDDLDLLYCLIRDWNVTTLGQLKSLLDSPVAGQAIAARSCPSATRRALTRSARPSAGSKRPSSHLLPMGSGPSGHRPRARRRGGSRRSHSPIRDRLIWA